MPYINKDNKMKAFKKILVLLYGKRYERGRNECTDRIILSGKTQSLLYSSLGHSLKGPVPV